MTAAPISLDEAIALHGEEAVKVGLRHAYWRKGDLRYLLHDGQETALMAIIVAVARRFVLCTGRRWGKSRLMCVFAALLIVLRIRWRKGLEPPAWIPRDSWFYRVVTRTTRPARVVYAAPTQGMVAEFIEPHMRLLAAHAPPELRPECVHGDWRWPDGDILVIKGCEDRKKADRLRGSEADATIADEGGFIPILGYVVRDLLGPQLWETRGHMLLPSTPPESPDHPFVEFLEEAERTNAVYRATTLDAPHLTADMLAEAIEDAGGVNSVAWQREGLAQVVRDPEIVVFPEFGDHCIGEAERPRYFLPHIIGDMGFNDQAWVGFGYYDFERAVIVIEDEVAGQHLRSDVLDDMIRETTRRLFDGRRIHRRRLNSTPRERADLSDERWQGDDSEGEHWQAVSANGGRTKGGIRALANRVRVACQRSRLLVHPRCTTLIAHARYARWNAARDDFERVRDENGNVVHHCDGAAGLCYWVRDCDATTNPYPRLAPGVDDDGYHIPQELRHSDAAKAMRAIFGRRGR